jgi:hypothetical protein
MKNLGMAFLGVSAGILLDVYGIICLASDGIFGPFLGEMMGGIGEATGIVFFFVWTAMIGGGLKVFKGKKMKKKFFWTLIVEACPFLNGISPTWTIYAVTTSMKTDESTKYVVNIDDEINKETEVIEDRPSEDTALPENTNSTAEEKIEEV